MERQDLQKIVDHCLDNAEQLLVELNEFYPFGTTLELDGTISSVDVFDGNDFPLSTTVISALIRVFDRYKQEQSKRVTAITYDVKAIDPNDRVQKDAIAVRIQHLNIADTHFYYFPYTLTADKKLTSTKSWGETEQNKSI